MNTLTIALTSDGRSADLAVDLNLKTWSKHKGYYKLVDNTGLSPPFSQVFLKHWQNRPAPGHDFLVAAAGRKVTGMPRIYGWGVSNRDHFYVFERLPPQFRTLDELLAAPNGERLINPVVLERLVDQAIACCRTLNRFEHVYTDTSAQNIMLDPQRWHGLLTDTDSAWSYRALSIQHGQADSDEFDAEYWQLWKEYVLKLNSTESVPSPIFLSQTQVLTLAAVFGRSLALLRSRGSATKEAIELIRTPSLSRQRPLWEALKTGDRRAFADFFLLSAKQEQVFTVWQAVFDQLVNAGPYVPWFEIRNAAAAIAALYPLSQARPAPVSTVTRPYFPPFRLVLARLAAALRPKRRILSCLRTDAAQIRQVCRDEIAFPHTHLGARLRVVWSSRDESATIEAASLVLLIHVFFGTGLTWFAFLSHMPIAVYLVIAGSVWWSLRFLLPPKPGGITRRLWETTTGRVLSLICFAVPLLLPPALALILVLTALPVTYTLIRDTPDEREYP